MRIISDWCVEGECTCVRIKAKVLAKSEGGVDYNNRTTLPWDQFRYGDEPLQTWACGEHSTLRANGGPTAIYTDDLPGDP
jgi:hypothetical protein